MSNRKTRMGGMSLGAFGGAARPPGNTSESQVETSQKLSPELPPPEPSPSEKTKRAKKSRKETQTTVNVKIGKSQQRWLQQTAQQVRDNNVDPVPPDQRVYPQHLIGVAIDLLKEAHIDWDTIKTAEDLRDALNL
jgi:hypothetical protein